MQMSSPQWGFNGGALIEQLRFNAPLTSTDAVINPQRGVGPGSFSRASASYLTDFEGETRKIESGSVGVEGSRVVTNLLKYSEDLSQAAWAVNGTATKGASNLANFPAVNDIILNHYVAPVSSGMIFVGKYTLSGTGTINLLLKRYGAGTYEETVKEITLSSTPQTYSITRTVTNQHSGFSLCLIRGAAGQATSVTVHSAQLENVTGQTITAPSEYIPTTTAAVTKCFSTTNANTVNGTTGVVTEATGTPLPQSYPERANSTAYTVGQKIQASGWWYTCTTGGTSHSSAPTWLTGKAGLVTVSDGTVTWTLGGRLLLGYVSEPASTNKTTAYGIIPADTLSAELITVEADRTFASDTGFWTKSADVTISGGLCNITNRTGAFLYRASNLTVKGKVYRVTYTATVTYGSVRPFDGTARSTSGTYTEDILCVSSFWVEFYGVAFTGSIDNVSVKEVTWAVGTKSFHNGTAFVQNITGLTLAGDVAAVLSIVTDQTEIEKAGLAWINPTWKVYKLDNSLGSVAAYLNVAGAPGNTNPHTLSVLAKTSSSGAYLQTFDDKGRVQLPVSSLYVRSKSEGFATSTTHGLAFLLTAGKTLYFILPQLEEWVFSTSINPSAGATSTRAATVLSYPVTGNLTSPLWSAKITATPAAASQDGKYMLGSYYDANNGVGLLMSGANAVARKRLGGSNYDATKALTLAVGTTKRFGLRGSGAGWSVFVDGTKGTDLANTATPAAGTTIQLGLDGNSGNGFNGYFRDLYLYNKPLADGRF